MCQICVTSYMNCPLVRFSNLFQVKSENDEYQKQALFVSGHRQELFELKSRNFGLQRQNANLRSQLSSAQQVSDSLRAAVQQLQEKRSEKISSVPADVPCKSGTLKRLLDERRVITKGRRDYRMLSKVIISRAS